MPILKDSIAAPMPHLPIAMQADLPLRGLTVLAVEDSRHAAEGLRLSFQRLGARLRRAETLEQATGHLRTYRPDVVLVDMGLPDGSGAGLIRQLACSPGRRPLILGCSADPEGRPKALAAGAQGFLEKPLPAVRGLSALLSPWFPQLKDVVSGAAPATDPLALRDDLARAARDLATAPERGTTAYLLAHLAGLARCSGDDALGALLGRVRQNGRLDLLDQALKERIGPVLWN